MDLPVVSTYNIHGAYFPLFPTDSSYRCDSIISSNDSDHNSIIQNIFSGIMDDRNLTISDTIEPRTAGYVVQLTQNSKIMSNVSRENAMKSSFQGRRQ